MTTVAELRSAITEFLCNEAWEGRWSPLEETNIRPLAEQIAAVLAPWLTALIDGEADG